MTSFFVDKERFLEKINLAARFTKTTTFSSLINQGILFEVENKHLNITSSNFSSFFTTTIDLDKKEGEDGSFIIETKKLIDFINYLPTTKIKFQVEEKKIIIGDEEIKGTFQKMVAADFPKIPKIEEKEQKIKISLWQKKLPLVLFSSSSDDSRPALTGVFFTTKDEQIVFVSTDGFRLSLSSFKKDINLPSMIIPSSFLEEALRVVKEDEVGIGYSSEEKLFFIKTKEDVFLSRLIESDFPPYEKVIPQEKKTSFSVLKEDFFQKIKSISVFTREISNIIVLNIGKKELIIKPKTEEQNETEARQEIYEFQGEETKLAFNIRFLIDFLSRLNEDELVVEILRPDAPVVFKGKKDKDYLHIIMPVRMSE